jgi:hypothetical protein
MVSDSFLQRDLDFADNLMEGEAFEDARKDEDNDKEKGKS